MFHLQTQTILSKLTSQILVGVVYYFITSQQVICSCLSHMFNCLVVYYFIISYQVICSCLSHMLSCPEVILCGLQDVKIQLSYMLLTTDRQTHTYKSRSYPRTSNTQFHQSKCFWSSLPDCPDVILHGLQDASYFANSGQQTNTHRSQCYRSVSNTRIKASVVNKSASPVISIRERALNGWGDDFGCVFDASLSLILPAVKDNTTIYKQNRHSRMEQHRKQLGPSRGNCSTQAS